MTVNDNAYRDIHEWIIDEEIKNEKGDKIDFDDHPFLFDIYSDQSQYLTVMKGAQVGMSTCQIIKNHNDAKHHKMDIIYTLPTDADVKVFVGGKVNRIIAANQSMIDDVADKDSIEQKKVGQSMIYFRGTWTKKAAIMVTADRLVHDEKDSSKLDVVSDYQARLQHSKFKQIHTFSHPDLPETGVDADWLKSDQKHWFIQCPHCKEWQYMSWDIENPKNMSVCMERKIFICKKCKKKMPDYARRNGQWVAKYKDKKWSGYWVPMLIAPWISAEDIIEKYEDPNSSMHFFYTKVLGLPYADASSKLLRKSFFQNLTGKRYAPDKNERVVIGIDTGLRLDYVIGNHNGLFYQDDCDDYETLNNLMIRWPKAIAVIDQGGDLIGARQFHARWPGRVYLCAFMGDRRTKELAVWGKGDEQGTVSVERNRILQLCVDEFRNKRILVHGTEDEWFEYWKDWNSLAKIKVLDPETNVVKGYKWVRSGRDHRACATAFWRVGMMRFAGMGGIVEKEAPKNPNSYMIEPNQTVKFNPEEFFDKIEEEQEHDWRL